MSEKNLFIKRKLPQGTGDFFFRFVNCEASFFVVISVYNLDRDCKHNQYYKIKIYKVK